MIATVKTTLDTIALNKSIYPNCIDKYKINMDCFEDIQSKEYNIRTIKIFDKVRNDIFGLERLELKSNPYQNTYDFNIVFNAKILRNDYLEGINSNTVYSGLEYLTNKLKPYINIKADDLLNNFASGYIDSTKNIEVESKKQNDYLKAINYLTCINRTYKDTSTKFIDNDTLMILLSYNEFYKIYNKEKETFNMIDDKKHSAFIGACPIVLEKAQNKQRHEARILSNKRIIKELKINTVNGFACLNDILKSKENINYDILKNAIELKENDLIDISKLNKKNDILYRVGKNINDDIINNNLSLKELKTDIYSRYEDRKDKDKKAPHFRYMLEAYHFYIKYNKDNIIDCKNIIADILEKLKVA